MSHEDRRPPAPRTPSHVHAHTHTHRVSSLLMQMLGMVINQQEKKGGGEERKEKEKRRGKGGHDTQRSRFSTNWSTLDFLKDW